MPRFRRPESKRTERSVTAQQLDLLAVDLGGAGEQLIGEHELLVAQGLELARCLRDAPDHTTAFAEYQRLRQPRAEAVVGYARAINKQKRVTKSRLGIAIRDAMLPMFLRKAADDTRNDWLYNHEIAWDAPVSTP